MTQGQISCQLWPEGICPGTIAFAPQGDGGFGYDPVFFLPQLRKTYAQLTPEEKAAVSSAGGRARTWSR